MKTQIAILLAALALSACSASKTTPMSSGSDRLQWSSESVQFDTTGGVGVDMNSSSFGGPSSSSVSVPLSLTQVASLTPPLANGVSLQANAIIFNGSKAYVAYNTQGAATAGGIDVIDFSVPASPVITSQTVLPTVDINALNVSGSDLYAVGANDSDNPAVLYNFPLSSGNIAAAPSTAQLPGYTGVAVRSDLLSVYALTGDNGGLSVISRIGLLPSSYTAIADARDMDIDLLGILGVSVVTGRTALAQAHVQRYNVLGLLQTTYPDMVGATVADGAKSTIYGGSLLTMATAGTGGTNLHCNVGGAIATNIPIPSGVTFPNLTPELRASNSAAFGNGLIYVANGAAGISVYTLELGNITPSCTIASSYVGRIMFPDGVSVNNVSYSGGKLIVATGLGGFRIISVTQGVSIGLQTVL